MNAAPISRPRALVSAAWAAAVLASCGPLFAAWPPFLREFRGAALPATTGAFLAAQGAHLLVAAAALALAALWTRAGRGPAAWAGVRARPGAEGVAINLIAGWGATATAFYALSLLGMFYAPILAVVLLTSGLPWCGWPRTSPKPLRSWFYGFGLVLGQDPHRPARIWILIALPALLLSPLVFVPPTYIDAWQYHLAVPEHFLKLHRYAAEGTNTGFHLELACEMQNVWAVLLRREELAAWSSLVPFLAAAAAAGAWLARRASPWAGGLGAGLLVAQGLVGYTAVAGKNDAACAAACLVALMAQADGRMAAAAVGWGVAAATKVNGGLFAALALGWWAVAGAGRKRGPRRAGAGIGLALLPALPMLFRGWLVKGDPHWPLLSRWIPGALWDRESQAALAAQVARPGGPVAALRALGRAVRDNLPAAAAGGAAVVVAWPALDRSVRRVAALCAAFAVAFTLGAWFEFDRLTLPALSGGCLVVAAAAGVLVRGRRAPSRRVVAGVAALLAWVHLAGALAPRVDARSLEYLTGALTREGYFASRFTTAWQARRDARALPGLRGLLLVNDHAPYLWPGRVRTEEFVDRKPTWALARETADPGRVAIRLRQWNVSHLADNVVGDFHVGTDGLLYRFYPWTSQALGVLESWVRRRLEQLSTPPAADYTNGGFYLYRLRGAPAAPSRTITSLPGTKVLVWQALLPYLVNSDAAGALRRSDALVRTYPGVFAFLHLRGSLLYHLGRWPEAYRDLAAASAGGYIGDFTPGLAAGAAVNMRRPDLAEPLARRALALYPAHRDLTGGILAAALALRARGRAEGGRAAARAALPMAREAAALSVPGPALVRLSLGEILRRAGQTDEARAVLKAVADALPAGSDLGKECRAELAACGPAR